VTAGFDKAPFLFKKNGAEWSFQKCLDEGFNQVRQEEAIEKGSFEGSKTFFKKGELENKNALQLDADVIMREKNTKHRNFILSLKPYASAGGKLAMVTSSDINGYLNYWDVSKL